MKTKLILSVLTGLFFASVALTSCNNQSGKGNANSYKPSSMGSTAELLVVLQNEQQWDNPIGKTIKKYFAADMYGMPQPEPIFKLLHLSANVFNGSFQKERNILMVNIDPKAKKAEIQLRKNVWAAPQLVFTVTAPTIESFIQELNKSHQYIINKFMEAERKRIQTVYQTTLNTKVIEKISKQFDLTMDVPAGYYVAVSKPGFMWIRHEASMYSQGILIISVPYIDTTQFSRDNILRRIQKFQQKYIPGPTKGSYMSLDRTFVIPKMSLIHDFSVPYTVEIKGLWKVQNDFMGGPFVSYTFLNSKNNQIVTLFGYVYQPNKDKRNLMLQVESVLYSTKLGKNIKN